MDDVRGGAHWPVHSWLCRFGKSCNDQRASDVQPVQGAAPHTSAPRRCRYAPAGACGTKVSNGIHATVLRPEPAQSVVDWTLHPRRHRRTPPHPHPRAPRSDPAPFCLYRLRESDSHSTALWQTATPDETGRERLSRRGFSCSGAHRCAPESETGLRLVCVSLI